MVYPAESFHSGSHTTHEGVLHNDSRIEAKSSKCAHRCKQGVLYLVSTRNVGHMQMMGSDFESVAVRGIWLTRCFVWMRSTRRISSRLSPKETRCSRKLRSRLIDFWTRCFQRELIFPYIVPPVDTISSTFYFRCFDKISIFSLFSFSTLP